MNVWKRNWRPWARKSAGFRNSLALLALWALGSLPSATLKATEPRSPLAALLDASQKSVELRLGRFEDSLAAGALTRALKRGVKVRLLLSRELYANRSQGDSWRAKGCELRWIPYGEDANFALGDDQRGLAGSRLGYELRVSSAEASSGVPSSFLPDLKRDFERDWKQASEKLPKAVLLEDELEALPDPRDRQPRLKTQRRSQ